jgi:AraC-like DNA-binding protein
MMQAHGIEGAPLAAIPPLIQMSLSAVPQAARTALLRDVYGPLLDMEFTPAADAPVRLDCDILALPSAAVVHARNSAMASRWLQPSSARDEVMLTWSETGARASLRQRGREVMGSDGHAVLTIGHEAVEAQMADGFNPVQLRFDRHMLTGLVPDIEDRLLMPIDPAGSAFRLLAAYVRVLRDLGSAIVPDTAPVVAAHLADLVALTIGGRRDAQGMAAQRGGRAARLAAVKHWTVARLRQPGLRVDAAAAAQGVSARYVQMLFAADGESFSAFVLGRRLALAYRALCDPTGTAPIGTIAFDAGFGDLSYFNRRFRAAYGEAPSDVRQRVRLGG